MMNLHPILPSNDHNTFYWEGKKYYTHSPDCYKCIQCGRSPEGELRSVYKGHLYCTSCYNNALKRVCATCNEPIFDQASKMENTYWHQNHFICSNCHCNLKPNTCVFNYGILKCKSCATEDQPKCTGCGKPILDQGLSACRSMWHPSCLKCQFCGKSVIGKRFSNVAMQPCCGECFNPMISEGVIDKKGNLIQKKPRERELKSSSRSARRNDTFSDSNDESENGEEKFSSKKALKSKSIPSHHEKEDAKSLFKYHISEAFLFFNVYFLHQHHIEICC